MQNSTLTSLAITVLLTISLAACNNSNNDTSNIDKINTTAASQTNVSLPINTHDTDDLILADDMDDADETWMANNNPNQPLDTSEIFLANVNAELETKNPELVSQDMVIITEGNIPGFLYQFSPTLSLIAQMDSNRNKVTALEFNALTSANQKLSHEQFDVILAALTTFSQQNPIAIATELSQAITEHKKHPSQATEFFLDGIEAKVEMTAKNTLKLSVEHPKDN